MTPLPAVYRPQLLQPEATALAMARLAHQPNATVSSTADLSAVLPAIRTTSHGPQLHTLSSRLYTYIRSLPYALCVLVLWICHPMLDAESCQAAFMLPSLSRQGKEAWVLEEGGRCQKLTNSHSHPETISPFSLTQQPAPSFQNRLVSMVSMVSL